MDYPIIMGITLFSALLLIIGNLLADVLYGYADPRIKTLR
jgi:peptide/nickel transport system permease protein